jgi:hypothetical protein
MTSPPNGIEEGRTRLAEVFAAALSDVGTKEGLKQSPAKEQPVELPIPEPFKPINPINRVAIEEQAKEVVVSEQAAKSNSRQQQKRVFNKLVLERKDMSLGCVIQSAIEAARAHDKVLDRPGSTVVETAFKGSPITATADSDPVDIAVDWTCHGEQNRFKEHYDRTARQLSQAEDELKKSDLHQNWICALNFGLGVAFGVMLVAMFAGLSVREYGTHLLRLLRSVTG